SRQPPAEIGNTGKTFLHSLVAQRGSAANAFLARTWGSPFQAAAGLLPGVGPGQKPAAGIITRTPFGTEILCGTPRKQDDVVVQAVEPCCLSLLRKEIKQRPR